MKGFMEAIGGYYMRKSGYCRTTSGYKSVRLVAWLIWTFISAHLVAAFLSLAYKRTSRHKDHPQFFFALFCRLSQCARMSSPHCSGGRLMSIQAQGAPARTLWASCANFGIRAASALFKQMSVSNADSTARVLARTCRKQKSGPLWSWSQTIW